MSKKKRSIWRMSGKYITGWHMSKKNSFEERSYCSGLWNVPGNKKRSIEHYEHHLPKTLDMIRDCDLKFYSNSEEIVSMVGAMCKERNIRLEAENLHLEKLPGWRISEDLVNSCKRMDLDKFSRPPHASREKAVNHYWRDLISSGADAYRGVLAIWMSKVELTASLASEGRGQPMSAWIDASVSRFSGKRERHNFPRLRTPHGKISHYANSMTFLGSQLPLNASFLCADTSAWLLLKDEFDLSTQRAVAMPYGHDEETILADCVWRQPDLFYCIGKPFSLMPFHRRMTGTLLRFLG